MLPCSKCISVCDLYMGGLPVERAAKEPLRTRLHKELSLLLKIRAPRERLRAGLAHAVPGSGGAGINGTHRAGSCTGAPNHLKKRAGTCPFYPDTRAEIGNFTEFLGNNGKLIPGLVWHHI